MVDRFEKNTCEMAHCPMMTYKSKKNHSRGFPGSLVVKNSPCNATQCKRHEFNPQSRKIPYAMGQLVYAPQLLSQHSRALRLQLLSLHPATTEACTP